MSERTPPLCACGCGNQVRRLRGRRTAPWNRYLDGHREKLTGSRAIQWKGGRYRHGSGYIMRAAPPGHPRGQYVLEHILVVESALGHYLRTTADVHHWNRDKADNRNQNLVACQDRAYHMLLHRRLRARAACGHPDWMMCLYCRRWDDPANLSVNRAGNQAYHKSCAAAYQRGRHARRAS